MRNPFNHILLHLIKALPREKGGAPAQDVFMHLHPLSSFQHKGQIRITGVLEQPLHALEDVPREGGGVKGRRRDQNAAPFLGVAPTVAFFDLP